MKSLSIVIPIYNRAEIVCRTLNSIAAQECIEKCKIILVDNNSTDNTIDVLSQWKDSPAAAHLDVTILSEHKPGAAAARNCGFNAVDTPWVMFFDSDDEMLPSLIADILDTINTKSDFDIVGWEIDIEKSDGSHSVGRFVLNKPLENHLRHSSLSTQRYAIRTKLLRKVGAWNESIFAWIDYELGVRILLTRPKMHLLDGLRVAINFTETSITGRKFSTKPETFENALDTCENHLREAGISTNWIDIRRAMLAANYAREQAPAQASRLLSATIKGKPFGKRLFLRLIYLKQRLTPRGTTLLASLLTPSID
ncbi:MAG: glycosyltransferase family 2 protein [Muribaculaceae bacterium]|nr:glycosyltransferase family 2 protein [Muribaculaceae bacterium]